MPRIDPLKLLVCLSVLLAPNGGIKTAAEVKRLANLMAKFSKKLVSKCIYIQILKCTDTELLGQFMQTGGWSLVHMWLVDGIGSKNWPLIQELLELLLCCPVDVERLKINSTPRLVKSLSTDSAHESVRLLATKLVEQWLYIVKAPKQLPSSMTGLSQSEILTTATTGLAAITDGKTPSVVDQQSGGMGGLAQEGVKNGLVGTETYQHSNGYIDDTEQPAENGVEAEEDQNHRQDQADVVDAAKKSFRAIVEHQDQSSQKKTPLVLKITTKNGKQVVAKVVSPSSKKTKQDLIDQIDDGDEDEDEEEVLVNIESTKKAGEEAISEQAEKQQQQQQDSKESKKLDVDGKEGGKERSSSSSSRDKDRQHHHHREKDRKGSSSSGSRSSSSKSSSGGSSSSSSKHKSSSSSSKSSSSSSRDKDKDRHGSSSSSSSKHKSSSSSSSKSNGSSSKSGSSSSSEKNREKTSHSSGSGSSTNKESKDSKGHSTSPNGSHGSSSKLAKLSRKGSKDAGNDSGSETSGSNTTVSGSKSSSSANGGSSSTSIPSKKASISIEVRNPENRPKTVKTYNSQFRSHGLIEEAPPPPSRKGLKKPSSTANSAMSSSNSTSASVGSTASGTTTKRSSLSPTPSSGKEGGPPPEKKPKEDPLERPGSIKLIPPKRQHALVESDMFMDALSATLRKDVKKRKRRTSGSESSAPASSKPAEGSKADGAAATSTTTSKAAPDSPTGTSSALPEAEATTPTTPTSPKPTVVPPIAPMSFYRDTLAEEDDNKDGDDAKEADSEDTKKAAVDGEQEKDGDEPAKKEGAADDEDETIVKKPKRVRCELNDEDDADDDEVTENGEKKKNRRDSQDGEKQEDTDDKTELMEVVMNDVEKKMAEEAGGAVEGSPRKADDEKEEEEATGKKPPGPGCGPDGPPGVLVIHRRKGPKKQLRWRVADELEEIRYFELDVTERCNVTKSFTDMKQMERVDERQKFLLARKVGSEDIMVERTPWRPLLLVDNVPTAPDGSQSVERKVQFQRERGCLQALYFNKHMIPDSPVEPDPVDTYQTADPVHIPLEDVTGNPDSVNDFTSMPWPDPKSTPPHESAAFNSPFFPSDLPPGAGFGPGGFPPPFPAGAVAAALPGPAPWTIHPRPGALQPGMFPLNQPPPGMAAGGGGGGGGGGSPNIISLPPNIPPPGMFPGATNFNAPPPDLAVMGDGRRAPGASGDRDYRIGPPPPQQQQWVSNNGRAFSNNNPRGSGAPGYGSRGGGPGNWNRSAGSTGDRGRNGEEGRGNYRGHWMQNTSNRGHNNSRGGGGRKW
ncbi:uncharacterized protein LOC131266740 [Anopheles coustani]|uniref:uncharacterized protein LOC131266740 n=1 Tax=Anopheles coustani TaxID=139045 RepID=UPI00265AF4E0|nr:uncharacterized protein LOC131266740 [Anopheles coustani]